MSVQRTTEVEETETAADEQAAAPTSITKDDAFHILQNARRRAVLRYLAEHDEQDRFRMRDVAEEVAAWEHDTTVQQLSSDERQRVYIALYQSHLPKLDEKGVIRYNQSRGVIERTSLTSVFEPFLEDGLHADSDLTIDDARDDRQSASRSSFTNAVSTILNR